MAQRSATDGGDERLAVARLAAQQLTGPPAASPEEVVGRLLAVQAQDPRGARLAVRSRSAELLAADVDEALTTRRSLVVSWLNRGTLHLVTAASPARRVRSAPPRLGIARAVRRWPQGRRDEERHLPAGRAGRRTCRRDLVDVRRRRHDLATRPHRIAHPRYAERRRGRRAPLPRAAAARRAVQVTPDSAACAPASAVGPISGLRGSRRADRRRGASPLRARSHPKRGQHGAAATRKQAGVVCGQCRGAPTRWPCG